MNALVPIKGAAQRTIEAMADATDPHEYAAARALWRAVLLVAWWDSFNSTGDCKQARDGREWRRARLWFRGPDMPHVARLAGLEPEWVRARWEALQAEFHAAGCPRNFLGRLGNDSRRTKGAGHVA